MRKTVKLVVLLSIAVLNLGSLAMAQEATQDAPQMTAEEKAMMEKWMKIATPGEGHKALADSIGSWTVTSTMWEKPGGPPTTSTGTSENFWALGGRFVEQRFVGTFNGMPFEGIGYTGYDNYKKLYNAVWMDTMGTMMMVMTGSADASGKVITMTGTIDDIIRDKPVKVRTVSRTVNKDKITFEMYGPDEAGKESRMMEMTYTRK
jgi:hypothetical protein